MKRKRCCSVALFPFQWYFDGFATLVKKLSLRLWVLSHFSLTPPLELQALYITDMPTTAAWIDHAFGYYHQVQIKGSIGPTNNNALLVISKKKIYSWWYACRVERLFGTLQCRKLCGGSSKRPGLVKTHSQGTSLLLISLSEVLLLLLMLMFFYRWRWHCLYHCCFYWCCCCFDWWWPTHWKEC